MPSFLTRAAAQFDRAVNAALLERARRKRGARDPEALGHDDRMRGLERVRALYDRPEHFEGPGAFFLDPSPIDPELAPVREPRGRTRTHGTNSRGG